ncbi:vomeronasal type-2 receptor 26-like isoform X5 [Hemicordylus capensis]|uniref:vomeronasal type-2 receptor 26-like isoform X5 n=1 Tax=Hemicordylus capensis TaxID=884348 RepID=UPI002302F546|nr:vomeronasal type-2 receptor 26-like isoform X5 [Hemicordylus capensis]
MVVLVVLLLVQLPHMTCKVVHILKCMVNDPHSPLHQYHQSGDLFIGVIASQTFIISNTIAFTEEPPPASFEELAEQQFCLPDWSITRHRGVPKNYQHILSLAFAVREINENPQLLPNVTLGFRIYESYFNAKRTFHAITQLISTPERFVPNYKCENQNNLIAVIGGLDPQTSLHVATVLDIYKIPQLIYGPPPPMNDKTPGLSFYQTTPNEALQYAGILSLLLYFRWTWIGILASNDE